MMTEIQFIQRVQERSGMREEAAARRSIDAVLGVLGEHLRRGAALRVAAQLPAVLVEPLRRGSHEHPQELDQLSREVATREGVALGFGMEHTQAVCQVVVEAVDSPTRRALLDDLPEDLRDAVTAERREKTEPTVASAPATGDRRTIASARPGSDRPLSESRAGARGTVPHADSVARSEDPHAATKLASARGKPRERGTGISEAKPGSTRPVSTSRD